MQDFLTEKELARAAKLSVQTLRNYRCERKIFPYIKIGKSVRYPAAEVEKVLDAMTIKARG